MVREDELFKKLNSGDETALDELICLYYPDIFRYCLCHTRDRQTAEDACQETFIKAVSHLDSYAHHGKFRAFLYKIAVNTCTDLWRREDATPLPERESQAEGGYAQIEAQHSFARMLELLPGEQRQIVWLRFEHELKIREIADILGLPLRTAQSRLRAALKTLKGALKYE